VADEINKISTYVNKVKWTYIQILINIKRYNIPPAKINRILKETILNNDIELFKIVRKYEYTMQWEKWEKLEQFDQSEIIDWGDALYYAILHKRIKILKLLLSNRSLDVNIEKLNEGSIILNTKSYETPLINAIDGGNIEVVSMLLELPRILVNFPDIEKVVADKYHKLDYDYILMTPLIKAIKKGNLKIIKLLLKEHNADVKLTSKIESPLMAAAKTGNIEIVNLLLQKKGIDINNVRHPNFNTALNIAVVEGYYDIVCLLLKNGASKDIKNSKNGEYAIHQDIKKNKYKIVKSLIDKDNVNKLKKNRETLLYGAVTRGDKKFVSLLLEAEGINVNKANENGRTPLWVAARLRKKDIVSMLLKVGGINVNKASNNGQTPLFTAAREGHKDIVSMLLKVKGINVNKGEKAYGETPLFTAAREGCYNTFITCDYRARYKDIVSMLLKVKGIDVNQAIEDGRGPVGPGFAADKGHQDIVSNKIRSMLRESGARELLKLLNPNSEGY
jgi:ankyrin repeat protein